MKSTQLLDRDRNLVHTTEDHRHFFYCIKRPYNVLELVLTGQVIEMVIDEFLQVLVPGDVNCYGGNAHYPDTDLCQKLSVNFNIFSLRDGMSGVAYGARNAPVMMTCEDLQGRQPLKNQSFSCSLLLSPISALPRSEADDELILDGSIRKKEIG